MNKYVFSIYFFNNDISFNISSRVFKIEPLILDAIMEGTMSQILYLGLGFYEM